MYIRPSQRSHPARSYPRILVIDQNGADRNSMRRILARHGLPSLAAADCCTARQLIESGGMDLIIVPASALAGEGAALRTVLLGAGLKVIVTADCHAWLAFDFLDAANALGASVVLQKPFTGAVMMQAVTRTLASPDAGGLDSGTLRMPLDGRESEWADFDWADFDWAGDSPLH